jgi:aromatase
MPITRNVEHEITVAAPAKQVYQLVADVANWPQLFAPTVHVEHEARGERSERIRIWATANGTAKTWTSRRELDPAALRIDFRQEVSQPPVGGMGGAWLVEPLSPESSRVRLLHDYHAATDDPADLAWIDQAVDRNSHVELAALKDNAEAAASDLLFSFDDTVEIDGSARDAYDFVNEAQLWRERLPHVARVELTEETPGLQVLEMDTLTKDGSTHTTRSIRVCRPHRKIVYKQIQVPALMTLHTGHWLFEDRPGGGITATSRHTVRINEDNIAAVLGADADVAAARTFVRNALSTNSLATLGYAKAYAESR